MSGHADYTNLFRTNPRVHRVPLVAATPESLRGLAMLVHCYADEEVINVPWPKRSGRPIDRATGDQAHPCDGVFHCSRAGDHVVVTNTSVPNGGYITGVVGAQGTSILTREANYHPCGSQIVFPQFPSRREDYVMLLAPPGDDASPSRFTAFLVPGDLGIHILPDVWHQPVYALAPEPAVFLNKQCSVHACVTADFLHEHNTLLEIDVGACGACRSRL